MDLDQAILSVEEVYITAPLFVCLMFPSQQITTGAKSLNL